MFAHNSLMADLGLRLEMLNFQRNFYGCLSLICPQRAACLTAVGHGLPWMVALDAGRLPTRKGICAYATTQIPFSQFVFYGIISLLPYRSG